MSNAVTGSAALTELKNDLTRLSSTLHMISELMDSDMSQVGQVWQDGKYQEFMDGYKPQIAKCEEISKRYKEWCVKVLDPTIENVIAVERTDVSSGAGGNSIGGVESVGNNSSAGAGSGGTFSSGNGGGKFSGFNFGSKKADAGGNPIGRSGFVGTDENGSITGGGGKFSGFNLGGKNS